MWVRVAGRYGTSAVTTTAPFTYVAPPAVTSVATTSGPTSGGTSITVRGSNFRAVTAVTGYAVLQNFPSYHPWLPWVLLAPQVTGFVRNPDLSIVSCSWRRKSGTPLTSVGTSAVTVIP